MLSRVLLIIGGAGDVARAVVSAALQRGQDPAVVFADFAA